jgi:transposase-like protein
MRNALAHVPKGQHTMVAAAIRQAFLRTNNEAAHQTWRHVAEQLRPRWPKLAALMDDSKRAVLAYMISIRSFGFSGSPPDTLSVSFLSMKNLDLVRRRAILRVGGSDTEKSRSVSIWGHHTICSKSYAAFVNQRQRYYRR